MDEILDKIIKLSIDLIDSGEDIPDEILDQLITLISDEIQGMKKFSTEGPIPPSSELLWLLSGGNPEAFANYLKTVPDRTLNVIATNPAKVRSMIDQLSKRVTLPVGEVQDGIPHADLNSSNIYGFQYDPKSQILRVRFQGDGVYEYEGVPPQIFKAFQAGAIPAKTNGKNQYGKWWVGKHPSLGATFYQLIRDQFAYRKVS